jgi:hypothetical protein
MGKGDHCAVNRTGDSPRATIRRILSALGE